MKIEIHVKTEDKAMLQLLGPEYSSELGQHNDLWFLGTSLYSLQWRHNGCDGVSNHQPHNCLLNRLFRRKSNKTSKLRVTGLCAGNSPVTGEFPAQMVSNAENISIWWRHHVPLEWITTACYISVLQNDIKYDIYTHTQSSLKKPMT